jgi:hypothetical protein
VRLIFVLRRRVSRGVEEKRSFPKLAPPAHLTQKKKKMNDDRERIISESPKKKQRLDGWFSTRTLDLATTRLSNISLRSRERRVGCRSSSNEIKLHPTKGNEPALRNELKKYDFLAFPMFYANHFSLLVFNVHDSTIYFYNSIVELHTDYIKHVTNLKKKLKNAGVDNTIILKQYFEPSQPPGNCDCAAYVFAFLYTLIMHESDFFMLTTDGSTSNNIKKYIPLAVRFLKALEERE